jgi:DNA-binding NtrC family response regulator
MSIQTSIAESPSARAVVTPSIPVAALPSPFPMAASAHAIPASSYTIPVSALADGMSGSAWRREAASTPPSRPSLPLPPQQAPGTVIFTVGQTIEQIEREMIVKTMHATHGNRTRAAKLLGISVRTLYTKLRVLAVSGGNCAVSFDTRSV